MSALILTTACSNDDDATGASTMKATTPSLSVALDFDSSISIVEQEATYGFTVSISEPQIVDIRVNLTQIGGDATNGEDFSMPPNVTIVAGKTSVSDVIAIHADDIPEAVETAVIQIANGNEANVVSISKATATFTILNLVSGDLAASMSWAANGTVTDNGGNEIDPYDLADLRLLLTDVPYTTILDGADGAGAETYVLSQDAPEGEYYLVADFYAAMSEIPADLDLTLTFNQVGVIDGQTHKFSAALNTTDVCPDLHFIMAKVTKVGTGDSTTYTFEEVGEKSSVDLTSYEGDWSVTKSFTTANGSSENPFTTSITGDKLFLDGIGQSFIATFWGEPVVSSVPVEIQLNADGTVVIPRQYIYTTIYPPVTGDNYDYEIKGSGSWNSCGDSNELTLQYDIYYPDDADGLAKTYSAFLNTPYLGGIFTLD